MSQASIVVLSVALAAAAATGVSFAMRQNAEVVPKDNAVDLQREVLELKKQHAELLAKYERLANAPATVNASLAAERVPVTTISEEQVAAAVASYLKKHGAAVDAALGVAAEAEVPFDIDRSFEELATSSYWENSAAWKKALASGRMDELIAKFEAAAKANPNDTKTQMQLANAYLGYLQMDSTKWQLSMKADKVFDSVLALDPTHWQARFTKALSYTFYPDFLGKKKDAISNFETLVQQQETMPVEASQAQTYLYLGNLLEARDPAKAREMWARGARRHPDNQELQKKLGN
jgi:tetratricopeptide (TPR) repeat protein